MKDIQDKLGVKNVPQLVRCELCGMHEKSDLTEK